jgi:hypothetical protein
MLTSNLLGNMNQLIPRCIFTVTMQSLVPLWQVQRCNHKFSQVFSVGERDGFVSSCARNGSHLVGCVYNKDKRTEIGFDVRHAVVVEDVSDNLQMGREPSGLCVEHLLIIWRGNTPVAGDEALCRRRLGCRHHNVALRLPCCRVDHRDGGDHCVNAVRF